MKVSFSLIVSVIFLAYIAHSVWVIYGIFFPTPCKNKDKGRCISPYIARKPNLEIQVFTSTKGDNAKEADLKEVWKNDSLKLDDFIENVYNISIPPKTRRNGTLYLHVFVLPRGHDPFSSRYRYHKFAQITSYSLPKSEYISLMGETTKKNESRTPGKTFTHLRSKVTISVLGDNIAFDRGALPQDIFKYIRVSPDGDYLPIVFIDELNFRVKDLEPINKSSHIMPLTITYRPISVGKLRFWTNMLDSMSMLHQFGFSEKDTDEVKGIFTDTNFYFLILTFAVAAFHLLFDFLAFKNDISYWKHRKTMVGLSTRAVIWRCVSTIIIFFYLMDEETSLLVLIPAGIGTIIEIWKVKKAFKVNISWSGKLPSIQLGTTSDKERETEAFDAQAMKYLSYLLAPLCIGGAVYSLLYTPHKSWYSWCIQSLVNGVYAFGFLFMLPQLFVNYKLKSVAHLPWRAFMYKAFNTFIDDIFAFIITMPTAHRLACFRDDVVFVVYLYQRWLYPVDKSRVNEYGMTFDEDKKEKKE